MADEAKDPKAEAPAEEVKEETPAEAPAEEAPAKESASEASTAVELSKDAQKIVDLVEKLPVLELANLVKALEEKFGVSAAAPMMMAALLAETLVTTTMVQKTLSSLVQEVTKSLLSK